MGFKNWQKQERVIEWDIHWYYGYLPATFIYHDIELKKSDYRYSKDLYYFWTVNTPDGKRVIKTTMGLAILYAPFFFMAHGCALLLDYPAEGFSEPYKLFLLLSAIFYLLIGLDFLKKTLRHYSFSDTHIAITILLLGLGTNLLAYSSQSAPMPHVYNFCLFSVFIYYTIKWYEFHTIKNTLIIGLLLGIISLIRPSNAVIFIFFIFYGISTISELKQRMLFFIKECFLLNVIFFLAILVWIPQFLYWKAVTGNYLLYSYTDEGFFFTNPQIIKGLFSFRKGWLVYTPMMGFALVGIFFLRDTLKKLKLSIILFFIINIYIIFSWWCWWYGGTFGQRSLIESYALLALPFASLIKYVSEKKWYYNLAFYSVALFFVWLNLFQTLQFENSVLHYEGMTKELYFKQFGKMERIPDYDKYVNWPNNEEAKKGNSCDYHPNVKSPILNIYNGKKEQSKKNIQLIAFNNKYVCADGSLNHIVIANRDIANSWETFSLIEFENKEYAIQAYNAHFFSAGADPQNEITATKETVNTLETFKMIELDSDFVAFKAANGKYLSFDEKTLEIHAAGETIGNKEKFRLKTVK